MSAVTIILIVSILILIGAVAFSIYTLTTAPPLLTSLNPIGRKANIKILSLLTGGYCNCPFLTDPSPIYTNGLGNTQSEIYVANQYPYTNSNSTVPKGSYVLTTSGNATISTSFIPSRGDVVGVSSISSGTVYIIFEPYQPQLNTINSVYRINAIYNGFSYYIISRYVQSLNDFVLVYTTNITNDNNLSSLFQLEISTS